MLSARHHLILVFVLVAAIDRPQDRIMATPAVHVLSYLILGGQEDAMREKVKYASLNSVQINFCVFHHVFPTCILYNGSTHTGLRHV